jgi:hypothetical protein
MKNIVFNFRLYKIYILTVAQLPRAAATSTAKFFLIKTEISKSKFLFQKVTITQLFKQREDCEKESLKIVRNCVKATRK